jgi:hypothetical protein
MARQQIRPLRRSWTTATCAAAAGHLDLHSARRRVDTAALGAKLAGLGPGPSRRRSIGSLTIIRSREQK